MHQSSSNRSQDRSYEKSSSSSNRQLSDNSRYTTSKRPSDFRYSMPVQTFRSTTDFSKSNRDQDFDKRDQSPRSQENSGKSYKCYKCHQSGHMMNQCPELKAELERKYGKRKAEAMFAACANTESDSDEEAERTRDSPEDRSSTPTPATGANATPLGGPGIEAGAIDTHDSFYARDFDEADC
jgi:Zinc knuckle